jgi:hypothetical protein
MVCSLVRSATKLLKSLRARYVASLRSRLLRVRLVALSCFPYLTFDDSFITRRALFVKYFFTEIENKLVYVNIDGARVICYCVITDAAREFPGCVLRKRGGEAWFSAFCAPHALPRVRQYR